MDSTRPTTYTEELGKQICSIIATNSTGLVEVSLNPTGTRFQNVDSPAFAFVMGVLIGYTGNVTLQPAASSSGIASSQSLLAITRIV